jgi:two-component system phosphate regulon sensor histidine kinase PhoR
MLNKYKIDFNDKLVHSLKTPISSVSIILSNLTKGIMEDKPETKQKYLNMATNEMSFMLTLTEKILTIVKLEGDKSVVNRSLTDLHLIINELKDLFSISNNKKQVIIHTSYQIDKGIDLFLDKTLMKDAISALIENAIKYSNDCVTIGIDCYIHENALYIRVIDNGFGIMEKDQKIIFKKFSRGRTVNKKEILGYGLGLSYVESIAHAHNGIVKLISDGKKGSEFTIVLPLNKNIYTQND